MLKYIKEQWLEKYNNWQIFRNPPGYANTNSNIESFNASIKRDFTFRKKLSVYVAVNKIKEIVHYYSVNKEIFHTIPKFNKKILDYSRELKKNHFKKLNYNSILCNFKMKELKLKKGYM